MDSKSKQFLDDPIGDLCALAAKLERYALDFSAPPSPLRPKSIRRASAHLQERGADVAQPAHSVWYRNFVLAPVNAMAAGGPTHLDISQMGTAF